MCVFLLARMPSGEGLFSGKSFSISLSFSAQDMLTATRVVQSNGGVCVCVCVCVCMCVCVPPVVCMKTNNICMCACCVCRYLDVCACVCTCVHVCVHVCRCVCEEFIEVSSLFAYAHEGVVVESSGDYHIVPLELNGEVTPSSVQLVTTVWVVRTCDGVPSSTPLPPHRVFPINAHASSRKGA